jgi:hypothetical protein
MKELQLKREEAIVEKELRKFEQDLQKSRPKFCKPYSRKNIASSDDENFWSTSSRVKVKLNYGLQIAQKQILFNYN